MTEHRPGTGGGPQAENASGYVCQHWAHCPLGVCVLARASALWFGRVMPQPFYPVTEHVFPASLLRELNFCEFYLLCEKFYPKTMRNLLIEQSVIKEKFGFTYHILKYWIVFFKGSGAWKSLWMTPKLSYIIKWELHLTWTKDRCIHIVELPLLRPCLSQWHWRQTAINITHSPGTSLLGTAETPECSSLRLSGLF